MLSHIAIAAAASALIMNVSACVPTLSEGVPYIVTSTQRTEVQWVGNNTVGSLGVDLSTTLPGTPWQFALTGFGGYAFSFNTEFSFCLFANASDNKIFASEGCFDAEDNFTLEQDFTFNCATCGESGAENCKIVSSATEECAAGASVNEQVRTEGCESGSMPMAEWNVVSTSSNV